MTNNTQVQLFHGKGFHRLIAFHTLASSGNMSFRHGKKETVLAARLGQLARHDIDIGSAVIAHTGTSDKHMEVTPTHLGNGAITNTDAPEVDILLTAQRDIYLGILSADCLALVYYDPVHESIAACHAGHAGLTKKVPSKTIHLMQQLYGADPDRVVVDSSPYLHKTHALYTDLSFCENNPDWEPFIASVQENTNERTIGPWMVDLGGMAISQLVKAGVKRQNIHLSPLDTDSGGAICFSHRHSRATGEPQGRMMTIIGMRP